MANKRFMELVESIKELHEKKNAGYAGIGAIDPWANFRYSKLFGVNPFIGCLVRMSDKFIRISNLSKNKECDKIGESIKDTLFDLSIYCLIAICLYEDEYENETAAKELT
jgi:hypothetical protein